MFKNNFPLFGTGRLLKTEMLEELRDFPRNYIDIALQKYCDGIITGCDIEVMDYYIVIKKGVIKYRNVIYILTEDKFIRYQNNNKTTVLKLRFLSGIRDSDFVKYSTEAYLDENIETSESEIELCRFKLRKGANLRNTYRNLIDFSTEFDTVNVINSPYAGILGQTLNPKITRTFAKELLSCNTNDCLDTTFAYLCIQSRDPIEKQIILNYISQKLNIADKNYSNKEVYNLLLQVLSQAGDSSNKNTNERRGWNKRILID